MTSDSNCSNYIGRIAPSPSGLLHAGHAQTFWIAQQRVKAYKGKLILRIEDIDVLRCKPQFLIDLLEDILWLGITWDFGPDNKNVTTKNSTNYFQSQRTEKYIEAWKILLMKGLIYPCTHSRRDVFEALSAPHDNVIPISITTNNSSSSKIKEASTSETIFPTNLRPVYMNSLSESSECVYSIPEEIKASTQPYQSKSNWRFRVPDGESINFHDNRCGPQTFIAGKDFGDFIIWRSDGYPAYELAVTVDDILMNVTEVVRGEDLLLSTARQLLLMKAIFNLDYQKVSSWHVIDLRTASTHEVLGNLPISNETVVDQSESIESNPNQLENDGIIKPETKRIRNDVDTVTCPLDPSPSLKIPQYYHAPLLCDANGIRLSKRFGSTSLKSFRTQGWNATKFREDYFTDQSK